MMDLMSYITTEQYNRTCWKKSANTIGSMSPRNQVSNCITCGLGQIATLSEPIQTMLEPESQADEEIDELASSGGEGCEQLEPLP